jgi:hypothetical protein
MGLHFTRNIMILKLLMHRRGTRKLDAFSCDSPAVDNTFQYSAGYDDDNDFVWSRVPDVTGNGSFGRCMVSMLVPKECLNLTPHPSIDRSQSCTE